MKLSELKKTALKIISEYSNNGNIISSTANADYLLRMNTFVNECQYEIARIRKLSASYDLPSTPDGITAQYYTYTMPTDFMELKGVTMNEYQMNNLMWEAKTLKIPKAYAENVNNTFTVLYYKFPPEITDSTSDDYDLTAAGFDPDAQIPIPYYLAARVVDVSPELPDMDVKIMSQYASKLARLIPNEEYGVHQVAAYYDM